MLQPTNTNIHRRNISGVMKYAGFGNKITARYGQRVQLSDKINCGIVTHFIE